MKISSLPSWICSLRIVRIIRKLAFQASWLNASIANNANIALYSVFHFFSGVSSLQHQKRLVSLQQNSRASLPVVSTLSRDHYRGWRGRAALRSLQSINAPGKEFSHAS